MQANPPTVRLARTQAEIINIYKVAGGLKSCMVGKLWSAQDNPVRAYNNEAGTLFIGVLYINDAHGDTIARCVARLDTDSPQFGRIYGNEFAMRLALNVAGYKAANNGLHGCELVGIKRSESTSTLVIPYLDAPSRYVLINLPTGRVWACKQGSQFADAILRKHELGKINDGSNLLLETTQYGWLKHDAFVWFGEPNLKKTKPTRCSGCDELVSTLNLQSTLNHGRVCGECLRARFVPAIVSSDGQINFVRTSDERLVHVRCAGAYVLRPVLPENVLEVRWSGFMHDYIRNNDAVFSKSMDDWLPRTSACAYRVLAYNLDAAKKYLLEFAEFHWCMDRYSVFVEYNDAYPLMISAIWLDPNEVFNTLCEGESTHGKAPTSKTPWGNRLQRISDWICASFSHFDIDSSDQQGANPTGIHERFAYVTHCTLSSIPLVEKLRRARKASEDSGDAFGQAAVRR